MRRVVLELLVIMMIIAGLAWLSRDRLGEIVFERAVKASYGADATRGLPDGLHVILCGTGSPLPDPQRSGPCTLVLAGKQLFLVDAGAGAGRRIGQIGIPPGKIDATLLTHFHSDHIDGLGEVLMLRWAGSGRMAQMPIYGPKGVDKVVGGFDTAYTADYGYRIAHHGADIMPRSGAGGQAVTVPASVRPVPIYNRGGVKISAFQVKHDPVEPALGYPMRNLAIASVSALALGLAACSAETEQKADAAAEAAGDDIEANANAAGEVIENAADDVEAGVDKAAKDLDAEADKAGDKIEKEWDEAKAEAEQEAQ